MRKSAFVLLDEIFGPIIPQLPPPEHTPRIRFNAGEIYYRQKGSNAIVEQHYKGRYCYLHHVQATLQVPIEIPIEVTLNDVHAVYLLSSENPLALYGPSANKIMALAPRRAIYLYVPRGSYSLHLEAGRYEIFSFYFDLGALDGINDRDIPFIGELRNAKRTSGGIPLMSSDFPAAGLTEMYVAELAKNLTTGRLDSQISVLNHIKVLIGLSQEKIEKQGQLHGYHGISIEVVTKMIESGVDSEGAKLDIKNIAADLPLTVQQLNNLFYAKMGMTLTAYKHSCLVQLSIPMLIRRIPVIRICDELGFDHERTFYRLFKRVKGTTTREYLAKNFPQI